MSAVNALALKSATDDKIPFITRPEVIATIQRRFDTLLQFSLLTKAIKITNNDGLNNLTYRTQSPSDILKTVEPNTEIIVPGWTAYIEINPNAVSGNALLEIDLVEPKDAQKITTRIFNPGGIIG